MTIRSLLFISALFLAALTVPVASAQDSSDAWINDISGPQYFAVLVDDVDAAVAWYGMVFGLQSIGGSAAEDGRWRIENLRNERLFVEIIRDDRAQRVDRAQGFVKVGFGVSDLNSVADHVEQYTGVRPRIVEDARFEIGILQLEDPEGNVIQLSSPLHE